MANTLYIALPSRAVANDTPDWVTLVWPFALANTEGKILQQGKNSLANLKSLASSANQVVLLLAASDVTLMTVPAPPMAYSKLKMALPNLVEDQLLNDPADSVLVCTTVENGHCSVAAVDKKWMQVLFQSTQVLGVRKLSAYALSCTIQAAEQGVAALLEGDAHSLELTLRSSAKMGSGITLKPQKSSGGGVDAAVDGNNMESVQEVLQFLMLMVPEGSIRLALPAAMMPAYQTLLESDQALFELAARLQLSASDWSYKIAGLKVAGHFTQSLDLMAPVALQSQSSFDWSRWKWSFRLAVALAAVWLLGLNLDALHLKQQADGLRSAMVNTYRQNFPKESTVAYPLIQMQQKIGTAKKLAGQSAPGDFLVLAAQFGQSWERALLANPTASAAAIVSMEYRNQKLFVKVNSMALVPLEQLRAQLRDQSLALLSAEDGVLQLASKKNEKVDAK
jgi:general secretion pathway protein L